MKFTRSMLPAIVIAAGALASTGSFAAEVQAFTPEALQAAMAQSRSVVFHVHATWCPVCAMQNEVLDTLLKEDAFKNYLVLKVDFDKNKRVVETLGAKMQSTLVVHKGPKEVGRAVGTTDPTEIRSLLLKASS